MREKQITRWRNKNKRKKEIERFIKKGSKVVVFDTETTGLDENAKIIQFSAIKYKVNDDFTLEKLDEMDIYINPCEPLSEKITEITGITDLMLAYAKDEQYWCPIILEFMDDCDVVCGYNTQFDIKMLHQMAKRNGTYYEEIPSLDVCEMARDWIPKSESEKHNLGSIIDYMFPTEVFRFHSSIEDVKATAMLLEKFMEKYRNYESNQSEKDYGYLERACLVINPRKPSEQRIKLQLNVGELGDIFWDVRNQEWGCCLNTRAKQYFNSLNLENLEEQFLTKYGYRFGCKTPKEIAKSWMDYKKQKKK